MKFFMILLLSSSWSYANTFNTEMSTVVVTPSRAVEQSISEAPASISVVTKEELEKRPIRDISDALQYAEGVSLSGSNDRGINLRGFGSSYTLILVDGKRLSSKLMGFRHNADADLSFVSPADIERIEVVRGPMATLYGADAIGGVVNIITKKPKDRWRTTLDGTYTLSEEKEQGDMTQVDLSTSGMIIKDRLGAKFGIRHSERPHSKYVEGEDARRFSGQDKVLISGELDFNVNSSNDLKLNVDFSDEIQSSRANNGNVNKTYVDRQNIGLEHKGSYGDYNTVTRVSKEVYKQDSTTPADLDVILAESQVQFPAFDSHFFIIGAEYQKYDLDYTSGANSFSTDLDQVSVFAEDAIQFSEKNTLTVGVRNTHHSRFKNHLTPRVYLNHKASEDLAFKAGVGTGYKAPSLFQLSEDFRAPSCRTLPYNCTIVGNPDLKPEKSITYEMGTIFTKGKWNSSLTVFYSELTNMINTYDEEVTPGDWFRFYHNVEDAVSQGVEFSTSYQASASLMFRLNFTYTDAENRTAKTPLSNTANSTGNLLADWAFRDNMSTYLALNYTGERDAQIGTSGQFVKANPYSILNAGYTYQFTPQATVTVGVENITNKLLEVKYRYGELGRRYFSKLSYTF